MKPEEIFSDSNEHKHTFENLQNLKSFLDQFYKNNLDRSLPFNELISDRWERAHSLGFGEKTSIYDNVLIFGEPTVGKNVWIGPFSIIDASGGLFIGDECTISSGVHIYSHDNIKQTLLGKDKFPIERGETSIGKNTYIAPNSIITMNVHIGNHCLIGANSLVNKSFPDNSIIAGNPAKKIGEIIIEGDDIHFQYNS